MGPTLCFASIVIAAIAAVVGGLGALALHGAFMVVVGPSAS